MQHKTAPKTRSLTYEFTPDGVTVNGKAKKKLSPTAIRFMAQLLSPKGKRQLKGQ